MSVGRRDCDVMSWGRLSGKCWLSRFRMLSVHSGALIRRYASFQVKFVIVGAKETSSPMAIFGMMSLVLCCIIWLSRLFAVVLIGVRSEMYVFIGVDGIAFVVSWWEAVEMDRSDEVRARLDVMLID